MKLVLIKIGKAWSVLRRDGFFRGSLRVWEAFLRMFRRVKPGDILFITNGVGDSARYRTEHVVEELNLHGFRASVTVQDNPFLKSYAEEFSVFIFHRTVFTRAIQSLIDVLKKNGKTIVFETDDLVYDPKYLVLMDYYQHMNGLEKQLYSNGLGGEIVTDPYVAVATTTTEFLAERLRERGKTVFIVPNRLSRQDVAWANAAYGACKKRARDGFVRLAYFSGTPSHNKDFATITEPLAKILEAHPETRLLLVGPLDIEEGALDAYQDQIERVSFVPREKLFDIIARTDINLAPLEIGNPFCESKSELKFFEAGIVGVPTVAAATDTFKRAILDTVDGMVAANEDEWLTKLERLITDATYRADMGEAAHEKALANYTTVRATNDLYYHYLRNHIMSRV